MKIAACAALFLAFCLPARAAPEAPPPARVIVKYKADSALMRAQAAAAERPRPQHAQALGRRLGLVMTDRWVLGPRMQSLSARGVGAAELARRLAAQPDVEWAVPVGRKTIASVPNDPYYGPGQTTVTPVAGQWYLRAPDNTFLSATNAIGAWALTTGSGAVTVAVLDTGVRFDHPDFVKADGSSKLWPGYDFVADVPTAADGNGRDADASDPGDFSSSGDSCGAGSSSWHGTQTAGIVGAATDNGLGIAGMGRNVMVLPVRVLGKCGGYDDDIVAAMLWAGGVANDPFVNPHPAKVLNMSLGSNGACDRAYQEAVDRLAAAGVTVVVAAGNEEGLAVNTPGNCVGAISVAGVRHAGTKVGFSSLGPEVTLAAPGGNCVNTVGPCLYPIMTTTNTGSQGPGASTYSSSGLNASYGTSFASPQVAATVALMLSADPRLTPAAIKAALQGSVRPFPAAGAGVPQCLPPSSVRQIECACTTTTCGAGMLDAEQAVRAVMPVVAAAPVAAVRTSATTVAPGGSFTLWSSGSGAFGNRSIASYAWAVVSGTNVATISGANDGPTAQLATSAPGTVTVRLTVTDSGGAAASSSTTLTVQDPSAPGPTPVVVDNTSPGGGGGGALSAGWLALLAAAVAALSADGRGRRSRRSLPA